MDIATDLGLEREEEDFGIALAYHGVSNGPYIVLPFLGPSNARDTFGRVVDTFVHPFMIFNYANVRAGIADKISIGSQSLDILQTRVDIDEAIQAGKEKFGRLLPLRTGRIYAISARHPIRRKPAGRGILSSCYKTILYLP